MLKSAFLKGAPLKLALYLVISLGGVGAHAANIVVTIATDTVDATDGEVSLREAITAANTNAQAMGAVLGEAPAGDPDGDTISFADGLTAITVDANELSITEDLVIDGGGDIVVQAGAPTRLFSVAAGAGDPVAINNMILQDAVGDADGGAVSVLADSTLAMTLVTLQNNTAIADNAGEGGGAINNQGTLTLTDVTVSNNTVDPSGPSVAPNGNGGGIFNGASATLTMTGGAVSDNTAGRAGGGIENAGGTVSLTNVTLSGNTITNNDPSTPAITGEQGGNGGALHSGGGDVTVTDCTVTDNIAGQEGGGLWNGSGTASMTVTRGSLVNNIARGAASDDGGGALFNNGGIMVVDGVAVTNNKATGALGSGGGLLNLGGDVEILAAAGTSRWTGNTAVRAGGAIEDNSSADGVQGTLSINGVDLVANSVDGGANTTVGNGGALHITGNSLVTMTNSSVAANTASKEGGGLWVFSSSTLTLANSTVSGNSAPDGGGIFTQPSGTLNLINATIASNSATVKGGGLSNGEGALVDADNTIIADNTLGEDAEETAGIDVDGAINADFSIVEIRTGAEVTGANNQIGDPFLADLAVDSSTQTRFHEITRGPALDTGNDSVCAAAPINNLDQRGRVRPADGNNDDVLACDIGAFERSANALVLAAQDEQASELSRVDVDSTDIEMLSFNLINQGMSVITASGFSGVLGGNSGTNFDEVISNVQLFIDDGDNEPSPGDTAIPATVTIDDTARTFNVEFTNGQTVEADPGTTFLMTATVTVTGTEAPAPAASRFILPAVLSLFLMLLWRNRSARLVLAASLGLSLLTACGSNSDDPVAVQGNDGVQFETFRFTATSIAATNAEGETVIVGGLPKNGSLISVPR